MPASRAAKEPMVADPERCARGGELLDPELAKLVLLVPGEIREVRRYDLAKLAKRAGHQRHTGSLRRVLGHRGACADRLVVRVGMHEHQTPAIPCVHGVRITTRYSPPAQAGHGHRPSAQLLTH